MIPFVSDIKSCLNPTIKEEVIAGRPRWLVVASTTRWYCLLLNVELTDNFAGIPQVQFILLLQLNVNCRYLSLRKPDGSTPMESLKIRSNESSKLYVDEPQFISMYLVLSS